MRPIVPLMWVMVGVASTRGFAPKIYHQNHMRGLMKPGEAAISWTVLIDLLVDCALTTVLIAESAIDTPGTLGVAFALLAVTVPFACRLFIATCIF